LTFFGASDMRTKDNGMIGRVMGRGGCGAW
jgi:hypothetical protein